MSIFLEIQLSAPIAFLVASGRRAVLSIWPAALVLLARFNFPHKYQLFFSTVGVTSLIACEYWLPRDASAVFYLAPFRFFEFAIGALCISAETRRPASSLWLEPTALIGLAAVVGSIITITPQTPLPGIYSLVPCLGAALVIYAGPTARVNLLLTNKIATGLGLISYSLYLCHWPIIVFARYIFGELTTPSAKIYLTALSIFVATWHVFFR